MLGDFKASFAIVSISGTDENVIKDIFDKKVFCLLIYFVDNELN